MSKWTEEFKKRQEMAKKEKDGDIKNELKEVIDGIEKALSYLKRQLDN